MGSAQEEARLLDQALVADARDGSARAFELLVERYHGPLLRYLTRQTGDAEMAADLAQETFLEAYRDLHQADSNRPFSAWLYTVARHNMLSATRKRRLRRTLSLDWVAARPGPAARSLHAADETEGVRVRDGIQRSLDAMSPKLREALLLHSLWGFPGGEVARILGISPAAARQRICRAKEEFDRHYRRDERVGADDAPTL